MSQDFTLPTDSNDPFSTAIVTLIPDAVRANRSCHSGAAEPTSTVAYMLWADTSGVGLLKVRNSADSGWLVLGVLGNDWAFASESVEFGSVSATTTKYLLVMPRKGNILRVKLLGATASSSSSGNEWTLMLENITDTVDLFSAAPGTFTSVSGVGGGSELAVGVPLVFTPDQNVLVDADDVLELTITKVGAPTSPITRIHASIEFDMNGE